MKNIGTCFFCKIETEIVDKQYCKECIKNVISLDTKEGMEILKNDPLFGKLLIESPYDVNEQE